MRRALVPKTAVLHRRLNPHGTFCRFLSARTRSGSFSLSRKRTRTGRFSKCRRLFSSSSFSSSMAQESSGTITNVVPDEAREYGDDVKKAEISAFSRRLSMTVPDAPAEYNRESQSELKRLAEMVKRANGNVVVITGAGLSTESGVPDYRSPKGSYSKGHKPMLHQEFMGDDKNRKRYWARSLVGFAMFDNTKPNEAHHALAALEESEHISHLITQNVDELHTMAGSKHVTELHGSIKRVRCQSCGTPVRRSDYQKTLLSLNEKWIRTNFPQGVDRWATERLHDEETIFRADGDADVVSAPSVARPGGGARYYPMSSATARVSATEEQPSSSTLSISGVDPVESEDFRYAPCTACGGILKPDVVFFGDTVPSDVVGACKEKVLDSDLLLVIGTSMSVYSAYRFARYADSANVNIAVMNMGKSRCDEYAAVRVPMLASDAMRGLLEALER